MPAHDPDAPRPGIAQYPNERDDARLLGVDREGTPLYYDPVAHAKLESARDIGEKLPDWTAREELTSDTSVSDLVSEVESTVGWSAMTDYAKEHVPGVGDDGDGDGDDT